MLEKWPSWHEKYLRVMWESFGADAPDVYDDWLLTDDFMVDSGAGENDAHPANESRSAALTPPMHTMGGRPGRGKGGEGRGGPRRARRQ